MNYNIYYQMGPEHNQKRFKIFFHQIIFRSLFLMVLSKKYIDQELPYLMRKICVPQWEEIKTRNSGATHHFWGKRAIVFSILIIEPKIICIRANFILTCFCWTVISHQSFSPFPSTSVGALGLITILPQCTVHNMRISEFGVPVYSSLVLRKVT